MQLTVEFIKSIAPNCKNVQEITDALNLYMPRHSITSVHQVSMFLAQAIHESGGFTRLLENLMYTKAERLLQIFPKDFKDLVDAKGYVAQPQRIANRVYQNQNGNGSEDSGDGWLFRGRGIFQLTGRANYAAFTKANPEVDAVKNPDLLLKPSNAVLSACWYWKSRGLNKFADVGDIAGCSKAVNGGKIGLKERMELYATIKTKLGK